MLLVIRCDHINPRLCSSTRPQLRLLIHDPPVLRRPLHLRVVLLEHLDHRPIPRRATSVCNPRRAEYDRACAHAEDRLDLGIPRADELDLCCARLVCGCRARDPEVVELGARLVRVCWHDLQPRRQGHRLERVGDVVHREVDAVGPDGVRDRVWKGGQELAGNIGDEVDGGDVLELSTVPARIDEEDTEMDGHIVDGCRWLRTAFVLGER